MCRHVNVTRRRRARGNVSRLRGSDGMQEKSDGRTLILKCDNRGGSTPRRDMASRERRHTRRRRRGRSEVGSPHSTTERAPRRWPAAEGRSARAEGPRPLPSDLRHGLTSSSHLSGWCLRLVSPAGGAGDRRDQENENMLPKYVISANTRHHYSRVDLSGWCLWLWSPAGGGGDRRDPGRAWPRH